MLTLAHGLEFADLYTVDGASRIDRLFAAHLRDADPALADRLDGGPRGSRNLAAQGRIVATDRASRRTSRTSSRICSASPPRSRRSRRAHHELAPLFAIKRQFVQRKAANTYKAEVAATFDGRGVARRALESHVGAPIVGQRGELAFATAVTRWLADDAANAAALDVGDAIRRMGAAHAGRPRSASSGGVLFRAPRKLDYLKLVPLEAVSYADVSRVETSGRPRAAPARGLCAHRPGHGSRRRTRPGALLHLVSRAGQGLVRARASGEKPAEGRCRSRNRRST